MPRFLALWTRPDDPGAFDPYYREAHLPLVEDWPGLRSATVTRFSAALPAGDPAYPLSFEAEVADLEALIGSEAFSRAAEDADQMMERYGTRVTLLTGTDF